MAKELLHGPKSLYVTSGNGTIEYTKDSTVITGNAWVNQHYPETLGTDYIEIEPNKTYFLQYIQGYSVSHIGVYYDNNHT